MAFLLHSNMTPAIPTVLWPNLLPPPPNPSNIAFPSNPFQYCFPFQPLPILFSTTSNIVFNHLQYCFPYCFQPPPILLSEWSKPGFWEAKHVPTRLTPSFLSYILRQHITSITLSFPSFRLFTYSLL